MLRVKRLGMATILGVCLAAVPSVGAPRGASAQANGALKLSKFRSYTRTCVGEITRDQVRGEPRFMCQRAIGVPSIFEAIGDESRLSKVSLMVGVPSNQIPTSLLMGLNFIRDVTGRRAGEIMPDDFFENMANGPQSFTYNGITIVMTAYPQIGMLGFAASAD